MRIAAALVLALGMTLGGCTRDTAAPMPREKFVDVMVSLRQAAQDAAGQAEFEARKASILQEAGVTEADLRAYARQAPRHPQELAQAYDSIAARLQRLSEPE